jgi:hypothetical protein
MSDELTGLDPKVARIRAISHNTKLFAEGASAVVGCIVIYRAWHKGHSAEASAILGVIVGLAAVFDWWVIREYKRRQARARTAARPPSSHIEASH